MTANEIKPPSHKSFARKAARVMWITLSIIAGLLILLTGVLLVLSPGKLQPFVDNGGKPIPGSISEKVFVNINGVKQGMIIQSKDDSHPVLLFLHGGLPEFFLSKQYPTGLEDYFTVVWWEQRGSGLSYSPDLPIESLTIEQLISDTLQVTNYLRHRFGKDKIYLMGHSGGTFTAVQAAARAPELYYAYIGEAQMVNQLKSEQLAYEYMLEQFKAAGNTKWVQKFEAVPFTMTGGTPEGYLKLRDPAMHPLGIGTMHDMDSVLTGIFLPSLAIPEYTLMEKFNLWRAKAQTGVAIGWDEIQTTDLSIKVPELSIPVYFVHGIYDYTVSYSLAKTYFEKLQAPIKGFYTFENSAHSPMFEEPIKMQQIMFEDVLVGTNNLADVK